MVEGGEGRAVPCLPCGQRGASGFAVGSVECNLEAGSVACSVVLQQWSCLVYTHIYMRGITPVRSPTRCPTLGWYNFDGNSHSYLLFLTRCGFNDIC